MAFELVDEKRLRTLEEGIERILSKLSEPVIRVQESEQDTYTIKQLAERLSWSRTKVEAELRAGTIRSHKVGGRIVVLRSELLQDLAKL